MSNVLTDQNDSSTSKLRRAPRLTKLGNTNNRALRYEVIRDETAEFGLAEAEAYLSLDPIPGERSVDSTAVQSLVDHIKNGTYNENSVVIATVWLGNVEHRLNGQHTAWAVASMEGKVVLELRQTVYKVTSEAQMKRLYATFDAGKPRTRQHLLKAMMVDLDCVEGIPPSMVARVSNGFKHWHYPARVDYLRVTPQQVAATIDQSHSDLFNTVGMYYAEAFKHCSLVKRASLVAAMFATFDKLPTRATEFWDPIVHNIGLTSKDDPRYRLREYLERTTLSSRNPNGKKSVRVNDDDVYNTAINMWNKWRTGDQVRQTIRILRGGSNKTRPKVK